MDAWTNPYMKRVWNSAMLRMLYDLAPINVPAFSSEPGFIPGQGWRERTELDQRRSWNLIINAFTKLKVLLEDENLVPETGLCFGDFIFVDQCAFETMDGTQQMEIDQQNEDLKWLRGTCPNYALELILDFIRRFFVLSKLGNSNRQLNRRQMGHYLEDAGRLRDTLRQSGSYHNLRSNINRVLRFWYGRRCGNCYRPDSQLGPEIRTRGAEIDLSLAALAVLDSIIAETELFGSQGNLNWVFTILLNEKQRPTLRQGDQQGVARWRFIPTEGDKKQLPKQKEEEEVVLCVDRDTLTWKVSNKHGATPEETKSVPSLEQFQKPGVTTSPKETYQQSVSLIGSKIALKCILNGLPVYTDTLQLGQMPAQ